MQDAAALDGTHPWPRPVVERRTCRAHRSISVDGAARGYARVRTAGVGIDVVECGSVGRLGLHTADDVRNRHDWPASRSSSVTPPEVHSCGGTLASRTRTGPSATPRLTRTASCTARRQLRSTAGSRPADRDIDTIGISDVRHLRLGVYPPGRAPPAIYR